jgi:succinate-acetate transporter protein
MTESTTQVKDTTGNPAPLGLLGFGITTVLLNFHNAGFYELNSMILAMGICYGGTAQVIAGMMEWKKGNTFATTAFISYGFFWLSLVTLVLLPKIIPPLPPPMKRRLPFIFRSGGCSPPSCSSARSGSTAHCKSFSAR